MSRKTRANRTGFIEDVRIDSKTGQLTRLYFDDGRPCPMVELTSQIARQYAGYCLIEADLADARVWLQKVFDLFPKGADVSHTPAGDKTDSWQLSSSSKEDFKLVKALWFAALVIYGKCFTQAEGRRVKLEKSNLPEGLRNYHDHIMGLRNTIVAHAGKTTYESSALNLVLHPDQQSGAYSLKYGISRLDFKDDRDDPVTFAQLISAAEDHVRSKRKDLEARIEERELRSRPLRAWYAEAKTPGSTPPSGTRKTTRRRRR